MRASFFENRTWRSVLTRGTALGLAAVLMCANSGCQDTSPSGDVAASSDTIPFISGETQRVALQSGCAQTVLECSTSRPVVILDVLPTEGQFVTESDSGFVVVGRSEDGSELLRFRGSRSVTGRSGPRLAFSWSSSASDNDPTTYSPGKQFSTRADAAVRLGVGFHYVRLTVRHDDARSAEALPSDLDTSFVEVEVEVRFSQGSEFFAPKAESTD